MHNFAVRGLGFFNDAYDLFVMNVVNVVLTEQYTKKTYTTNMKSSVSAAALIGAIIGQVLFGVLGDVFGRRITMIATCGLLIIGGILCTVAYAGSAIYTLYFLVVARGILGIGIGGEYPLAAASTAEDCTNVAERNSRVALIFSLQGVGSLTAAIFGNLLVESLADQPKGDNDPQNLEIIWRILFGIGVIPACAICYSRIKAEETEAYKALKEQEVQTPSLKVSNREKILFIGGNYWKSLLGTAGTWFLFDIVFYAQNLFSASILSVIGVSNPSLRQVTTQNVFIAMMGLPGYYVACYYINRLGRKKIQLQGFFMMTLLFLSLGVWWDQLKTRPVAFIILFGLILFFANFGPNTTTFVMPTEMFPTPIRGTCHGFSAAAGKAGAALGSFGFSIWVENDAFGYSGAFFCFAGITALSIPLTWYCCFDNNIGLADLDKDFYIRLSKLSIDGVHPTSEEDRMSEYRPCKTPTV